MIYLAILLVLCGLLIIIAALSIETGRFNTEGFSEVSRSGNYSGTGKYSDHYDDDGIEIIVPGDMVEKRKRRAEYDDSDTPDFDRYEPELFDDEPVIDDWGTGTGRADGGNESFENIPDIETESQVNRSADHKPAVLKGSREKQIHAVLFDDRSNIIDYESGTGVIDSTFARYRSLKRIGSGTVESDHDGVSFFLDGKLHRFDFHKVYDVWSGQNYIALPLKGNSTVKLFIIENSAGFPEKVEADYKEFEKGL